MSATLIFTSLFSLKRRSRFSEETGGFISYASCFDLVSSMMRSFSSTSQSSKEDYTALKEKGAV